MTQDTHIECPRLLRELRADLAAISEMVTARIEQDDEDYGDAAIGHHELTTLVTDSLAALLDAIADTPHSLEPARRIGRLKAERGIPLDSLLHAFRVAGLAFWEVIVERADHDDRPALPQLSTLVWATIDEYSVAATDAYRRIVVAADEQPGHRLLRALLDPDLPPTRREDLCRRMRLPARGTFVVLVGDIRLVATGVTTVRTFLSDDRVTLAAADSPVTLDRAIRAARTRAGASKPFTDLVSAPAAFEQARLAFRCLSSADTGIHMYASSPARALIAANSELAEDVLSDALAAFDRLHPDDADALVQTALAWYELGGSTSAVGERLHLHRNTVLHRLKRIERLTGSAFAVPADAALLYLALQARLLQAPGDRS
ncbi:helix-turn-helix domain-containing protein [Nocardia sp. NBC_00508]|uniref:helix-turn-helix domain-containing protein n=1 Tax=Nocardia sp. NBC_00508 TaxID=2975992 RepID=UPI002E814AD5|nr:helix-turn-helix domain-containing protein [Nocardia sp. NBC_00508]WUD66215.1 helix-turn-helix domain-containing protein [Nocardia sp. NBC_00508]